MKRSGLIAGLIIIALTAGSVIAFGKSYARNIYTYDCEILEQRPEQLTKFCADGGVYVYDITWKSWGYNGAEGTGTYSQNLCEPNCAEGKRVEEQVDLYLSGIENIEGKRVLRYLSVNTQNGVLLPSGNSYDNWDVAEFAVNMKDFEKNE
ncbi:hypothetical protein GM51_17095 [freshwater metagenome]|uniref:Uncharacterized protein n=1 Tax=freshwater metagenome TaxID=449393 RepID=A0A094QJD8_9ZZZZ